MLVLRVHAAACTVAGAVACKSRRCCRHCRCRCHPVDGTCRTSLPELLEAVLQAERSSSSEAAELPLGQWEVEALRGRADVLPPQLLMASPAQSARKLSMEALAGMTDVLVASGAAHGSSRGDACIASAACLTEAASRSAAVRQLRALLRMLRRLPLPARRCLAAWSPQAPTLCRAAWSSRPAAWWCGAWTATMSSAAARSLLWQRWSALRTTPSCLRWSGRTASSPASL